MISDEELIQKIAFYRARYNLTQKEFADKVGITQCNLSLLECGKVKPTKRTKAKILLNIMEEN